MKTMFNKILSLMFISVLLLAFSSCSIIKTEKTSSTKTQSGRQIDEQQRHTAFSLRVKLWIMTLPVKKLWEECSEKIEYEMTI